MQQVQYLLCAWFSQAGEHEFYFSKWFKLLFSSNFLNWIEVWTSYCLMNQSNLGLILLCFQPLCSLWSSSIILLVLAMIVVDLMVFCLHCHCSLFFHILANWHVIVRCLYYLCGCLISRILNHLVILLPTRLCFVGFDGHSEYPVECALGGQPCYVSGHCCWVLCAYDSFFHC